MNFTDSNFPIFYMKMSNIWKDFCIFHSNLLDATISEYEYLLSSNLDELDIVNSIKNELVEKIKFKEDERKQLLNEAYTEGIIPHKIESLTQLEKYFLKYEESEQLEYFSEFSSLLKKILKNLRKQNKQNQIFIHKALNSLATLREDMAGQKSTEVYSPNGKTAKLRQSC